jgi:hypothetical protein
VKRELSRREESNGDVRLNFSAFDAYFIRGEQKETEDLAHIVIGLSHVSKGYVEQMGA